MSSDAEHSAPRLSDAIFWIGLPGRRFGMLGRATALEGDDHQGPRASLVRAGSGWIYNTGSGGRFELDEYQMAGLLEKGLFSPKRVRVVPDFADQLFQAAVEQAEASLAEWNQATEYARTNVPSDESEAMFGLVILGHHWDKALRRAIAAVILAVAAAEAQVNTWAEDFGGWIETGEGDEDKLPLTRKAKALARKADADLDVGRAPWQALHDLTKFRDRMVHSKPEEEVLELGNPSGPTPGWTMTVEARRACRIVRDAMIELARLLGRDPPRYLAYCPPVPPDDDEGWRSAVLRTGAREDPDFPPIAPPVDSAGPVPQSGTRSKAGRT